MRGADDHGVARHDGRCMETDFAGDEVDFLIVILLQIDDAVFAEGANRRAGLRIECDEAISGSNVEDSFFAPIAPIRESPARELTGRILTSGAFTFAMGPEQPTGPRVDSNDGASPPCRSVQNAVGDERRRPRAVFRRWP